jgi:TonB family protein
VLASEEDGSPPDALQYSMASDIVELVVLTGDEAFLQTMRDAVGGARRLWHVPTGDKVSDLLLAGQVGIVVLDVGALLDAPSVFVSQIKRQFPDLVVVVAGTRADETALAALISAGTVYRFIHKPMSPGRARLFAEAAVRKYGEQRRSPLRRPPAPKAPTYPVWLIGAVAGAFVLIAVAAVLARRGGGAAPEEPVHVTPRPAPIESPQMASAAAALAANRLTEPPGDNALELYLQAQARNPADAAARAGLTEVRERLLARAENALLEERLDEAAAAIEIARRSGVEGGRITFLGAQLQKSRERTRSAQTRARSEAPAREAARSPAAPAAAATDNRVSALLEAAVERVQQGRLTEPPGDSARHFIEEALKIDPADPAALEARQNLGTRLLTEARFAIDRRDFSRATAFLAQADGIAPAVNIQTIEALLNQARHQADTDAWSRLLKTANERILQDRLIDPDNDSAKYYLLTLRGLDPSNAGLASAVQDLGTRLVAKARRALTLEQYDAAKSWMEEASSVGFASPEGNLVQHDLSVVTARQKFMSDVLPSTQLTLVKSVPPVYPPRAEQSKQSGWVELDFTVTESGGVTEVALHNASNPGVFDEAAMKAMAQWRYSPVLREGKAVAQRSRVRIRFNAPG